MTATTAVGVRIGEGDRVQYAGFGYRLAAGLVDLLVFVPVFAAVIWATDAGRGIALAFSLAQEIAYFAYTIIGHARWGQTLGKRVVGIRVLDVSGRPIGWRQAVRRSSVDIALGVISQVSYWVMIWRISSGELQGQPWSEVQDRYYATRLPWVAAVDYIYFAWIASEVVSVLFNKRQRALHDFIAGTVVVVERPRVGPPAPPLPGWRGVLNSADTVLIGLGVALAAVLFLAAIGVSMDPVETPTGWLAASSYGVLLACTCWAARRSLRYGSPAHWAWHVLALLLVLVPVLPFFGR